MDRREGSLRVLLVDEPEARCAAEVGCVRKVVMAVGEERVCIEHGEALVVECARLVVVEGVPR